MEESAENYSEMLIHKCKEGDSKFSVIVNCFTTKAECLCTVVPVGAHSFAIKTSDISLGYFKFSCIF